MNITYSDKIDTIIAVIQELKTQLDATGKYKNVSINYEDIVKIKEYPFIVMKVDNITPEDVRELGDIYIDLYIVIVNKVLSEIENLTDIKPAISILEDNSINDKCKGAEITSINSYIDAVGNSKTAIYEIGLSIAV